MSPIARLLLLGGLILGWPQPALSQSREFKPDVKFSLSESWRWHELEPLNDHIIYRGIETPDENLVFAGREHLLIYDGYAVETVAYPPQTGPFEAFDLFHSQNGDLIITSNFGVFSFRNDQWRLLREEPLEPSANRRIFARSRHGAEFIALPSGLFRIIGGELHPMEELRDDMSSIGFDRRDRLWFTRNLTNEAGFIPMDESGRLLVDQTREFDFGHPQTIFPWLIVSPETDEVWAVNWRPGLPPLKFDNETLEWEETDLRSLSGDNSHTSGFHLSAEDMLVFSKSALLIKHEDEWQALSKPEFDFPINQPFFIQRQNGRIVLGGRGERIYEVDYATPSQSSYEGLHFQCDVAGFSSWFISIGGQVMEHNHVNGSWVVHESGVIDTPLAVIKADDNTIWAAGAHEGIAAVSWFDGRRWTLEQFPEMNAFFSHLSAVKLSDGRLAFGSGDDIIEVGGGLVIFERVNGEYVSRSVHPPHVPTRVVGITEDANDHIWFGGFTLSNSNSSFTDDVENLTQFSRTNWIDHVVADDAGQIWIAQWERGLFTLDDKEWVLRGSTAELADSQVSYILRDEFRPGSLWFATNSGVSRFDGERWIPRALPPQFRFTRESGTLKQSSDGALWVNFATRGWYFRRGTNFYITRRLQEAFRTVRYQLDTTPPEVRIIGNIPKTTAPSNIQIQWEGVDRWSITPRERLKFSYRLNDGEWSPFAVGSSKVFLDLPSGDHRFEIRALDLDGNLSDIVASREFSIIPPLWQRPWFLGLTIFTFTTIVVLTILLFRQRLRHLVKMEEFKLQFFTNISHELRTPLTVILGPLESQLSKLPKGWDKRPLEIAYKNAQRTLTLIDQILDFRRAETGSISVNLARADLSATVAETYELIRPMAEERSQSFHLIKDTDHCPVWVDASIIEKILNNLISNSIKYTQLGGEITVRLRTTESLERVQAQLIVEDNGGGIPAGKIDNIFEVFYRAGNALGHKVRGSGIGLAYTKNLVEACQGTIVAESPIVIVDGKNQGTRFTVSLTLKKIVPECDNETNGTESTSANAEIDEPIFDPDDDRPLILLAEDDEEISHFLRDELRDTYRILLAKDGAEGLRLAKHHVPDIVITDVMMPELDGKALCRNLKNGEATAHIPVVMLTALKSEMHELEGLEIGADDYLTKPIRVVILKQRIRNLLDSRAAFHRRFDQQKESPAIVAKEVTSNPVDEAFMEKALGIVEENISDPLFDVEVFSDKMFMSRMTLYRKFKGMTGDTPGVFIRSIRMNKAAGMLATGDHNVSETSAMVGFTDLSSFSTAFKNYFDVPPSKYNKRR